MLGQLAAEDERVLCFGPFHLLPTQRLLLEGDRPVRLGSRALELLIVLLERPGELVSKEELTARVWPGTVVVEANLTVQIAALRRALHDRNGGNRYLLNIPGRGYCFVAPVITAAQPGSPMPSSDVREWDPSLLLSIRQLIDLTADATCAPKCSPHPRAASLSIVAPPFARINESDHRGPHDRELTAVRAPTAATAQTHDLTMAEEPLIDTDVDSGRCGVPHTPFDDPDSIASLLHHGIRALEFVRTLLGDAPDGYERDPIWRERLLGVR
jgi:DNA-binding winged helix-turn-helix (wHTH) protein